jgi:hypothetical protein
MKVMYRYLYEFFFLISVLFCSSKTTVGIKKSRSLKNILEVITIMSLNRVLIFAILLIFSLTTNYHQAKTVEPKSVTQNSLSSTATAISNVIDVFLVKKLLRFDLLICGEATNHIKDLTNEVLIKISKKTTTVVHRESVESCISRNLDKSAVIFTKYHKVVRMFNEFNSKMRVGSIKFSKRPKIFFYVEEESTEIIDFFTPKLSSIQLNFLPIYAFEFLLLNEEGSLKLKTISYFTEGKCEEAAMLELNSLSKTTGVWNKKLVNFEHLSNFHACLVTFLNVPGPMFYADELKTVLDNAKEFHEDTLFKQIVDRGNLTYRGFFYEITKAVAQKANFTAYHQLTLTSSSGDTLLTHSGKILYTKLIMESSMFTRSSFTQDMMIYHNTAPFASLDLYYLITPNDFYTNYEKLSFPFEQYAWISFGLSFAMTYAAILVVNRLRTRVRNIIYGMGIESQTLNAVSIFFGISQIKLPRENFPRMLLSMFIFLCLIFRTCYQSKMFEFMTTDMRRASPETIEDLCSMNYTVVVQKDSDNYYLDSHDEIINGRLHPRSINQDMPQFYMMYQQAIAGQISRHAFLISELDHKLLNSSFMDSLAIMKGEKIRKMVFVRVGMRNLFSRHLDEIMERLIPSGIPQQLFHYGYSDIFSQFDVEEPDNLRILSISDMEFGFAIWLAAFPLPIIVFICELLSLKVKRKIRKLAGLIQFLRLLRARMSVYHD